MTLQGAMISLARYKARKAVKEDWRNRGHKLAELSLCHVVWAAEDYLKAHPELFAEAAEMIRRSPRLQRLIAPRKR